MENKKPPLLLLIKQQIIKVAILLHWESCPDRQDDKISTTQEQFLCRES